MKRRKAFSFFLSPRVQRGAAAYATAYSRRLLQKCYAMQGFSTLD